MFQASHDAKFSGRSHRIAKHGGVWACEKCGCISRRGLAEFDRPCRGKPAPEGRRNLECLRSGDLPGRKRPAAGQRSLLQVFGLSCSSAQA
eukprot:8742349-Alexandrium_andersonii.AAC.1